MMATRSTNIPSRQDRQAARLRGAGTARIQNAAFKIQGGPPVKAKTPARTPRQPTPRRPQLEDPPQSTSTRRGTLSTPSMAPPPVPPPKSSAKNVRAGPASKRKSIAQFPADLPSDELTTPAVVNRRARGPARTSIPLTVESPPDPVPTISSSVKLVKRKTQAQEPPPATSSKRPRKSLAPPVLPSPSVSDEEQEDQFEVPDDSESEIFSAESTPEPAPRKQTKKRKRRPVDSDDEEESGTVEIRVHKLAPATGGSRALNEIDGFLQIVTEIFTMNAHRILRQDATQAKILDAFTEEVTIRLIEMTDVWDSHAVLAGALKKAQRRKMALRQELLAIRRERGEIQREMEVVRQSHELGEQQMTDLKTQQDFIGDMQDLKARLNDSSFDEANEGNVQNGIEAALVELRPLVAGKSGIAGRLASFNRFLERFDQAITKVSG